VREERTVELFYATAYPGVGAAVMLAAFLVGETRRRLATGVWR
jgi:hypothetical protein